MRLKNLSIIAQRSNPQRSARTPGSAWPASGQDAARLAAIALVVGSLAAGYYWAAGLTLSHYDARAHLVVARRIFDSLTPGWQQVGAVWLPLPHLLNALPVQIDALYRTGASATAISVTSLALAIWALARVALAATGSRAAAFVCTGALLVNPDVLYLSATPMTEPLLIGLSALSLWLASRALSAPAEPLPRHLAGATMASACLVRYEAWPMTGALLGLSLIAHLRSGTPCRQALRHVMTAAAYPLAAVLLFMILGRATVGEWFVSSGFYVPETLTRGRAIRSLVAVWWGAHHLTGYPVAILGSAGLLAATIVGARRRSGRGGVLLLTGALVAAAALPWYAFYAGHPFRFRYMVALVPALALGLGILVGLSGRRQTIVAPLVFGTVLFGPLPFVGDSPVLVESRLDERHRAGRGAITAYLDRHWDGEPVLASMGALAHYMQDLAGIGFNIRDFVHEGNGAIWETALRAPAQHVRWVLVEEEAEGGDVLAIKARSDASYLKGFERVAEGGRVALYRRAAPARPPGPNP
ncbi:MAG: hypothetical protein AB1806_20970 [Acidobacteriota bacterium]